MCDPRRPPRRLCRCASWQMAERSGPSLSMRGVWVAVQAGRSIESIHLFPLSDIECASIMENRIHDCLRPEALDGDSGILRRRRYADSTACGPKSDRMRRGRVAPRSGHRRQGGGSSGPCDVEAELADDAHCIQMDRARGAAKGASAEMFGYRPASGPWWQPAGRAQTPQIKRLLVVKPRSTPILRMPPHCSTGSWPMVK